MNQVHFPQTHAVLQGGLVSVRYILTIYGGAHNIYCLINEEKKGTFYSPYRTDRHPLFIIPSPPRWGFVDASTLWSWRQSELLTRKVSPFTGTPSRPTQRTGLHALLGRNRGDHWISHPARRPAPHTYLNMSRPTKRNAWSARARRQKPG